MLWKGHQLAIGELMTESKPDAAGNTELHCIGFAKFTRRWKAGGKTVGEFEGDDYNREKGTSQGLGLGSDGEIFRGWFGNIERGIYEIDRQRQSGDSTGLNRVRRLQHLLLELVDALDSDGARARESSLVSAAPNCACTRCQTGLPKARAGNV